MTSWDDVISLRFIVLCAQGIHSLAVCIDYVLNGFVVIDE
jgi:hypothetical protein